MRTTRLGGLLIAAIAASFFFTTPVIAQEDDGGPLTQGEDAKYVSVRHVKFKPGTRERALEIVNAHFVPASESAGTPGPLLVNHMQTGKWDVIAVWDMEGGMADLEWYRTEDDIKWFAALAEQEGGVEQAQALLAEYGASIADFVVEVGHRHTGATD